MISKYIELNNFLKIAGAERIKDLYDLSGSDHKILLANTWSALCYDSVNDKYTGFILDTVSVKKITTRLNFPLKVTLYNGMKLTLLENNDILKFAEKPSNYV